MSAALLPVPLVLGSLLRRTSLLTDRDAQTAAKIVAWVTLPSVILQAFNRVPLQQLPLLALPLSVVALALQAGVSWLVWRSRHPKERGLLAGCSVGSSVALIAVPLAQALVGSTGLRTALLAGLVNSLAVWLASFGLFSTAGAAFPEAQQHLDGGTYRGEWTGMLKEGFGVYTYASGARYEGEWRNNQKEGRGVYYFPKGGVYEGEWRKGLMAGVGVRTFSSGKVQAGVWQDGKLAAELEEWQCALAVEGANEAAAAARRVKVGSASVGEAAQQLLAQPATWAYGLAAALVLLGRPLTPTLDVVTSQLASAHAPLALLTLGLSLDVSVPPSYQVPDVSASLAVRLVPPLLLALAAAGLLHFSFGWPINPVVGLLTPLVLCWAAPVAPQTLAFAHRFRLNESLAAAIASAGNAVCLAVMAMAAGSAVLSAVTGSLLPFCGALAGMALAITAAAAFLQQGGGQQKQQQQQRRRQVPAHLASKVRMVYAGPDTASQSATDNSAAGTPAPDSSSTEQTASAATMETTAEGTPAGGPTAVEPPNAGQQRRRSAFTDVDGSLGPLQPPSAACLRTQRQIFLQKRSMRGLCLRLPALRCGSAERPPSVRLV